MYGTTGTNRPVSAVLIVRYRYRYLLSVTGTNKIFVESSNYFHNNRRKGAVDVAVEGEALIVGLESPTLLHCPLRVSKGNLLFPNLPYFLVFSVAEPVIL